MHSGGDWCRVSSLQISFIGLQNRPLVTGGPYIRIMCNDRSCYNVQVDTHIFGCIYLFVCEADLEILMLCVRPLVSQSVVMLNNDFSPSDQVTKWPSHQVTKWPSDQVTKWSSDQVTEWLSDRVTKWLSDRVTGSFADDWPDGIFIIIIIII